MADMETAPSSVQEHLGGRLKYGEIMPEKKRSVNQSFVSRGEFLAMSGPVRMRDLWAMRKEKKQ